MKTINIYIILISCFLIISYGSYSQGNENMKFPDASQFKIDKNIKTNILTAKSILKYKKSNSKYYIPNMSKNKNFQVRKYTETSKKPYSKFNFDYVKEIKNILPPIQEMKSLRGKRLLVLPEKILNFKK